MRCSMWLIFQNVKGTYQSYWFYWNWKHTGKFQLFNVCGSQNNVKFSSHQFSFKLDWSKFGRNLAYYLVIYCAEFH